MKLVGRQIIFHLIVASTLLAAGCSKMGSTPHEISQSRADATAIDECPLQTPAQWGLFLEQSAQHEEWVQTCEDSPCDQDFNHYLTSTILDVLSKCSRFIQANPRIASCTDRLRRFVPAWIEQHTDHSFGFTLNNADYARYEEGSSKPSGLMVPPHEIVAALPDAEKVRQVAISKGYQFLTHTSCLGGNRIFLYLPDAKERFDQWLLINITPDLKKIDPDLPISFIGVQKQDALGHRLEKVRLNFRDYFPIQSENGYKLQIYSDSNGKCYSCHNSGMRKLMLVDRQPYVMSANPVKGDADYDPSVLTPAEIGKRRWREFNRKLMSYGLPDWDGTIHVEDHGPALGEKQGCIDCHNGVDRGILTIETSNSQIDQKIWKELAMPPETGMSLTDLLVKAVVGNPPLKPDEQERLGEGEDHHDDILKDYEESRLPTLRDWLLQNSCS